MVQIDLDIHQSSCDFGLHLHLYKHCCIYLPLFLHSPFCRAEGLCQHAAIPVLRKMLRILSCDWSIRFMRVILTNQSEAGDLKLCCDWSVCTGLNGCK